MIVEHRVKCNICMKVFNARENQIRLICNECYEERPPNKKELIKKFLDKIRHIPLFWVIDNDELKEVYEAIDEIRDHYQKVVKE